MDGHAARTLVARVTNAPYALTVADLNRDGQLDIAAARSEPRALRTTPRISLPAVVTRAILAPTPCPSNHSSMEKSCERFPLSYDQIKTD